MKLIYFLIFCVSIILFGCDNPTSSDNKQQQNTDTNNNQDKDDQDNDDQDNDDQDNDDQDNDDQDNDDQDSQIRTSLIGKWILVEGKAGEDGISYNPSTDNYLSAMLCEFHADKSIMYTDEYGPGYISDTALIKIVGNKIFTEYNFDDEKIYDTSAFTLSNNKLSIIVLSEDEDGELIEGQLIFAPYNGPIPPPSWTSATVIDNGPCQYK